MQLRVEAESQKNAAVDKAAALKIVAEGEAEADKIRTLAAKLRHAMEAEAAQLMNAAHNMLTPESRASNARMRLLDKLEGIIRESVKPMEKIEGIKILHVDGLGGSSRGHSEGAPRGDFAENIVNSALRYRAQAPLIDNLLKEIGVENGDITKITSSLGQMRPAEKSGE